MAQILANPFRHIIYVRYLITLMYGFLIYVFFSRENGCNNGLQFAMKCSLISTAGDRQCNKNERKEGDPFRLP